MELRILLPRLLDEFYLNELFTRPNLAEGALLDGDKIVFRKIQFDKNIENKPDELVTFYDVPSILSSAAKLFAQELSNRDWKKMNRDGTSRLQI
jgi:hypothetical protein